MNATLESLNELHKRILAEAKEQDGLGIAKVAVGLRMAAGLVIEEIENQEACEKVDAMPAAEAKAMAPQQLADVRRLIEVAVQAGGGPG